MEKMEKPPIVLFFNNQENHQWPTNAKLEGCYHFARSQGWRIQVVQPPDSPDDVRRLIRNWAPVGCLVDMDGNNGVFTRTALGKTPTVFLDFDNRILGGKAYRTNHDPNSVAELAASHLTALDHVNYAFLGFSREWSWSNARRDHFRRHLGKRAQTFSSFVLPAKRHPTADELAAFERWLVGLPKPCGLLLASDRLAEQLYPACAAHGIAIPTDLSVIGIDDNEKLCNNLVPPLSSISLDFTKAGWMMSELLYELLHKPLPPPVVRTYGLIGLSPRQSTARPRATPTFLAKRVMELIQRKAPSGISAREVAAAFSKSRRLVEMRFRDAYGKSILETILDIRLERICELLKDPSVRLSSIPQRCGYHSSRSISELFRRRYGLTMRDWRKRHLHAKA